MNKKVHLTIIAAFLAVIVMVLTSNVSYADEMTVDNGIPVMYITIDESKGTIDAMNNDKDHNTKCVGTVSIDVPDGFRYSDMQDVALSDLAESAMEIKGRGNSSWNSKTKKPYKLKLDKKANVLGLGKNKHWVLIANAYDRTLIKDRVTAWLGDDIGMEFTPRGVPVDIVMRNTDGTYEKYLGSYYLSEQVRVGENRIEIEELEEGVTDTALISGGYVVQNGGQTDIKSPNYFVTKNGAVWANHTPNFDPDDGGYVNDVQRDYIRGYMQDVEDALYSGDFEGAERTSYRDMMDIKSAAKYWLVMQASMNADAYVTGSTYLYKDRDDILYWGPLWDFDYAWYYDVDYSGFQVHPDWVKVMLYDKEPGGFVSEIRACWPEVKDSLLRIAEDGGVIDQYYEETKLSQQMDLEYYPIDLDETFEPESAKEQYKAWIINRVTWMDEHMDDLDNRVHKVTVKVQEDTYYVFVEDGYGINGYVSNPVVDGFTFLGWEDEEGNPVDIFEYQSHNDDTIIANMIPNEEATLATDIFFRQKDVYIPFDEEHDVFSITYTVIPEDAQNKDVKWTSSDDDVASYWTNGTFNIKKPGDVTITATLASGVSKTITLHIVEEELPDPKSIKTEKDVYELIPGEYAHIEFEFDPYNSRADGFEFTSSDENVVKVTEAGVLRAIAPGEAYITIVASNFYLDGTSDRIETKCKVIVTEDNPPVEEITYSVVEGNNQAWTKGSKDEAVFIFKRSKDDETTIDHFDGIKNDRNVLDPSAYTAESGSLVIRMKPEYLETLSVGKHNITVSFDEGITVDGFYTIVAADEKKDDEPKKNPDKSDENAGRSAATGKAAVINTGDESRLALALIMMVSSAAGAAAVALGKRKMR